MRHTFVSPKQQGAPSPLPFFLFLSLEVDNFLIQSIVQYAGNKDPFLVTLVLSSVQLISMLATATLTDRFGRRPLTVYPYAVTVVSVLCLGIIGCFDYTTNALSSLLVCLFFILHHCWSIKPRLTGYHGRFSSPA